MKKFHQWCVANQDSISWFLIGVLLTQTITCLGNRQYLEAAILGGLAFLNYFGTKLRMV